MLETLFLEVLVVRLKHYSGLPINPRLVLSEHLIILAFLLRQTVGLEESDNQLIIIHKYINCFLTNLNTE